MLYSYFIQSNVDQSSLTLNIIMDRQLSGRYIYRSWLFDSVLGRNGELAKSEPLAARICHSIAQVKGVIAENHSTFANGRTSSSTSEHIVVNGNFISFRIAELDKNKWKSLVQVVIKRIQRMIARNESRKCIHRKVITAQIAAINARTA